MTRGGQACCQVGGKPYLACVLRYPVAFHDLLRSTYGTTCHPARACIHGTIKHQNTCHLGSDAKRARCHGAAGGVPPASAFPRLLAWHSQQGMPL